MLRLTACALTLVAALSAGAFAAHDQAARTAAGTRIRGRVVTGTGQALVEAQVRAVEADLQSDATGTAQTDASGVYEIAGLPAGRYVVTASRSGFAPGGYGQIEALGPGAVVTLGAGQAVEGIDVRLFRDGAIGGRVTGLQGAPVAGAQVTPIRRTFESGQWHFAPADPQLRAVTTAAGEFTLSGVPRGSYYLAAAGGNRPVNTDNTQNRSGYATTLYPGTVRTSEAQVITMNAGSVVRADISLVTARLSGISGRVVGADGSPLAGGSVGVRPVDGLGGLGAKGVLVRAEGAFLMLGLPPGRYHVQTQDVAGASGVVIEPSAALVTVGDDNVAGVVLRPVKMVKVTGHIVVDPAVRSRLQPGQLEITSQPANADGVLGPQLGGRVNDDLTFELRTWPGSGSIRARVPPGWAVKAVRLAGADITDTGLEFREGQDVTGLDVEITNRAPVVSGGVAVSQAGAIPDYSVVLFSQDRVRWTTVSDRYLALGRRDQLGTFTVRSLPPGDYYAVALAHVNRYEWRDPAFLETLRAKATAFSIAAGETKTLKLDVK